MSLLRLFKKNKPSAASLLDGEDSSLIMEPIESEPLQRHRSRMASEQAASSSRTGMLNAGNLTTHASGARLAFGLKWSMLMIHGDEKDFVRSEVKKHKAAGVVDHIVPPEFKNKEEHQVFGFYVGPRPKRGQKIYSAASTFARHCSDADAVFIIPFGPNEFGILAKHDHVPHPNFDVVGDVNTVTMLAHDFSANVPDGAALYLDPSLHGTGLFEDVAKHFSTAHYASYLDTLDDETLINFHRSTSSGTRLRYVVIPCLIGGIFTIYLQYQAEQERQRAAVIAAQSDPASLYARSRDDALATLRRVRADIYAKAVRSALWNFELSRAGWAPSSIKCISVVAGVSGPQACTVELTNKFGTYRELIKDVDKSLLVNTAPLIDGAAITVPLTLRPDHNVDLNTLPTEARFNIDEGSKLQQYVFAGLKATLSSPQLVGSWPNGNPPAGHIGLVLRGQWTLTGAVDLFEGLEQLPSNMTISSINFSLSENGSLFTANGDYYVK
jgi:hypothetical protein